MYQKYPLALTWLRRLVTNYHVFTSRSRHTRKVILRRDVNLT